LFLGIGRHNSRKVFIIRESCGASNTRAHRQSIKQKVHQETEEQHQQLERGLGGHLRQYLHLDNLITARGSNRLQLLLAPPITVLGVRSACGFAEISTEWPFNSHTSMRLLQHQIILMLFARVLWAFCLTFEREHLKETTMKKILISVDLSREKKKRHTNYERTREGHEKG
jgi:hypothetical protein